jgi:transposase-like protein
MQHAAKKVVKYTRKFQQTVLYAVMREGISIASVCSQFGIDHPYAVREWVRREMKKRGLVRIPKTMVKRKSAPQVLISEPVNRQFQRYEEIIMYQQCMLEAMYQEGTPEQKKKLLGMLTPKQRKSLKQTGKLST